MSQTRKRAGIAAVVAGLITVGGLALAGPASASGSKCISNGKGNSCAGAVDFTSDGEIFTVHDYSADGYGVVGHIEWTTGGYTYDGTVSNHNGEAGAPVTANFSIPEGTKVYYYVALTNNGDEFKWSSTVTDTA